MTVASSAMPAARAIDHAALAEAMPLDEIDVSHPSLYQQDVWQPYFRRLRREAPVHYCKQSALGPYWSVTKHSDIMAVEVDHKPFSSSSTLGGITMRDRPGDLELPMFIAMDPPKHDAQRKVVSRSSRRTTSPISRPDPRAAAPILDGLPIGETFDWVDRVSIELTTQMLATLFDFPFEDRRKLTCWSDVSTAVPEGGLVDSEEQREAIFRECLAYFIEPVERAGQRRAAPRPDLDAGARRSDAQHERARIPRERHPADRRRQRHDAQHDHRRPPVPQPEPGPVRQAAGRPELIASMVSETIRWQTPLAHMRRTALADFEFGGKQIKKGDKVVMWYVSGNRDEEAIENPNGYIIDRERPRQHLSFGFGIHRCVGNRLAEMQLKILWEEILKRLPAIEVVGPPKRVFSAFVHGITELPARIPV